MFYIKTHLMWAGDYGHNWFILLGDISHVGRGGRGNHVLCLVLTLTWYDKIIITLKLYWGETYLNYSIGRKPIQIQRVVLLDLICCTIRSLHADGISIRPLNVLSLWGGVLIIPKYKFKYPMLLSRSFIIFMFWYFWVNS